MCNFFISIGFLGIILSFQSLQAETIIINEVKDTEDIFQYIFRIRGNFDQILYQQIVGAANAYKEGDEAIGVLATDETSRENARKLLSRTKIKDLHEHPLLADNLQKFIWDTTDPISYQKIQQWTLGELKEFLLNRSEHEIKGIMNGLNSEIIGCIPKLMSNEELIRLNSKIFNPLPGSQIGAQGYLSARIQPNSPTDNIEEIIWQVFSSFSYAVGDIVIGNNPVDSTEANIAQIENSLREIVITFGLEEILPWCVLSHVDIQRRVEAEQMGSVAILFQSLAGTDACNKIFDISIEKMIDHAKSRVGSRYGLYYETGQGADFTNGAAEGVDMVVLESRKYGFARGLTQELTKLQTEEVWTHFNNVAGFIGPEVFKSREQLVRCCLEDIAMGKLHGLCAGLDVCSTLHMEVTLEDLDWCLDQIMPANPAYLMALPTKNDPMLSYLTTSYQDHVRLRNKFGFKVNDAMWEFFKRIEIVGPDNRYTDHFGDPIWVYYQYRLAKKDTRSQQEIYAEGQKKFNEIHQTWLKTGQRVPLAAGYGKNLWDLNTELDQKVRRLYEDAKKAIWAEFTPEFFKNIPDLIAIRTLSQDRKDYILHPPLGEVLSEEAITTLEALRKSWKDNTPEVQIVISDGLNARSIMRNGHLLPFLSALRKELTQAGYTVGEKNIIVTGGRVRVGYRIGDILFAQENPNKSRAILHMIGERPGTGQDAFSVYMASPKCNVWAEKKCDHNIAKVVSGISELALKPEDATKQVVQILLEMMPVDPQGQ